MEHLVASIIEVIGTYAIMVVTSNQIAKHYYDSVQDRLREVADVSNGPYFISMVPRYQGKWKGFIYRLFKPWSAFKFGICRQVGIELYVITSYDSFRDAISMFPMMLLEYYSGNHGSLDNANRIENSEASSA